MSEVTRLPPTSGTLGAGSGSAGGLLNSARGSFSSFSRKALYSASVIQY